MVLNMAESVKPKETAKKKVTRKLNPEETLVRGPEYPVDDDEKLVGRSGKGVFSPDEVLAHGFVMCETQDLDPFDNERNYVRVCPDKYGVDVDPIRGDERSYNKIKPAYKYGAKEKQLDQDSEDYGKSVLKESDHQDD
jgi:hypothetical protein